ncbi:hypothetical protein [Nocardioides sp. zg-1228]|uniref:hypothetical protein n=1 Tax=Nocardioides sp. zg-1228 TaxID=2763008 RepID=UPI0016428127|nr:hypothetical protein [Nocardioides sp. zg-1228]MBC2931738.1 hypothetical protein [Nocardioides sp. zg-1228]QSF57323.1 hypothetical protein JX575_17500 [Nocardioides sp. zg-1228]
MRDSLRARARRQDGLFTRQQALRAGYTRREIDAAVRPNGPWIAVRTGVYCERLLVEDADQRLRWMFKDRAALLVARRQAVLSHDSAARFLEIDTLAPPIPATHLTHTGARGNRTNSGIVRHRDLLPLCVEVVDGLLVTSYARTAIDIGRLHGFLPGLVAVDAVRGKGVPLADLAAELARMGNHPHIARARAAVAASDAGAESVLETLGRQLVRELEIGEVETQFAVGLADGRVVWCDIRVGRHIFECHGMLKLVPVERGGVATQPAEQVLWKERARQVAISAEGLGVSSIVWADCLGQARDRALARLRREYAVTEARFGRELPPHLRRFADDHPRRRDGALWTTASHAA